MRKVILTANDFEMFDTEISSVEFEFYQKHRDAFPRMWKEQGKSFWISFIMTFRKFAVEYGAIKEFPTQNEQFQDFIDKAFILVHENFVDAKVNQARSFLLDIVIVAQHKHTIQYLESKSYAKDPFYAKDTREVFRRLFGVPTEKASYLKVYMLLPIYMKFGGAVCVCLRRWLDADEVPEGSDFEPLRKTYNPILGGAAIELQKQAFEAMEKERSEGNEGYPIHTPGWPSGKNPKFFDPENPLYDLSASVVMPWYYKVDGQDYMNFFIYSLTHYNAGLEKVAEVASGITEEDAKKGIEYIGEGMELDTGRVHDHKMRMLQSLREGSHHRQVEATAAFEKELEHGVPRFPVFVPEWPLCEDPRFFDEKNPLYNPKADRAVDWRSDVSEQEYERFYNYVQYEYGKPNLADFHIDFDSMQIKKMGKKMKGVEQSFPIIPKSPIAMKSGNVKTMQQEAFDAYKDERTKGYMLYPSFVPNWPKAKDPRFYDDKNPLYKPDACPKSEWIGDLNRQEFETFFRYVQLNYKNGKRVAKGGEKKEEEERKSDGSGIDEEKDESVSPPGETKKKRKRNKKKKKSSTGSEGAQETGAGDSNSSAEAQARGPAESMTEDMIENIFKARNFLQTLVHLVSQAPPAATYPTQLGTVVPLVQDLIDGKVEAEDFIKIVQAMVKSPPEPYLAPFLKKSLPFLRCYMIQDKITIEGIRAPPQNVLFKNLLSRNSSTVSPKPDYKEKEVDSEMQLLAEEVIGGRLEGKTYINYKKVHTEEHVCQNCHGCRHKHVHPRSKVEKEPEIAPKQETSASNPVSPTSSTAEATSEETNPESQPKPQPKHTCKHAHKHIHVRKGTEDGSTVMQHTCAAGHTHHKHVHVQTSPQKGALRMQATIHYDKAIIKGTPSGNQSEKEADTSTMDSIGVRDAHLLWHPLTDKRREEFRATFRNVDPVSGLTKNNRVLLADGVPYTAVLHNFKTEGMGKHEYIKLQVLESTDTKQRKYTVFTATGVVGDMKGTVRNHDFGSDKAASLDYFKNQYATRTGNMWVNRQNFMKFPGRFYPVDLDDTAPFIEAKTSDTSPITKVKTHFRSGPFGERTPWEPRLIESLGQKEASVVIRGKGRRDQTGHIHISLEKGSIVRDGQSEGQEETDYEVVNGNPVFAKLRETLEHALNPSDPLPSVDLAMEDDLLGSDEEIMPSRHYDLESVLAEVEEEMAKREDEDRLPLKPHHIHALKTLENLEDLSTLVKYTNDVKKMNEDMDRAIREACEPRSKKQKSKAKDKSSSDNPTATDSTNPHETSDKETKAVSDTKPTEVQKEEQGATGGEGSSDKMSELLRWKQDYDLLAESCDSMMNGGKGNGEKEEALFERLKSIFIPKSEPEPPLSPPPSPPPMPRRKKSIDTPKEALPKFTVDDDLSLKQFKFNALNTSAGFAHEKRSGGGGGAATDSCVKISPNLTDDTKVELLSDGTKPKTSPKNTTKVTKGTDKSSAKDSSKTTTKDTGSKRTPKEITKTVTKITTKGGKKVTIKGGMKSGFMLTKQNSPVSVDMGELPAGMEHLQFTHMVMEDGSEYMVPFEEAKRLHAKYGDAFRPKFPFKDPITHETAVTETKSAAHLHFDLRPGTTNPHPFKLNFTPTIKIKDATNPAATNSSTPKPIMTDFTMPFGNSGKEAPSAKPTKTAPTPKSSGARPKSAAAAPKSAAPTPKPTTGLTKAPSTKSKETKQTEAKSKSKSTESPTKESGGKEGVSLRVCSGCSKKEPTLKAYKKCAKCKQDKVTNARYYCGRDCQVADWSKRHKDEHKNNQL